MTLCRDYRIMDFRSCRNRDRGVLLFYYPTASNLKEKIMGKIGRPQPVMLFVGMLSGEIRLLDQVGETLEQAFGPVADQSPDTAWNFTDYYRQELGERIFRRFLFFQDLISPDRLAKIKVRTNGIEENHARSGQEGLLRRINLDPGYLDASKVVLASTKDYSHRIYLGRGIYAETTLTFSRGGFVSLDHTYPDYRSEEVMEIFHRMRNVLMQRRKNST